MQEAQKLVADIHAAVVRLRELVQIHAPLQNENFARSLIICGTTVLDMERELEKTSTPTS
jgi:hypothetical protein